MKWASIVVVTVLVFALVTETFFLVNQFGKQQQLVANVFGLQQDIQASEGNNEKLTGEIDDLKEEMEQLSQEKSVLIEEVTELEKEVSTLSEENSKLSGDLKEKSDRVSALAGENRLLESKFMCERTLSNVDFSNNESVNKSLKKYVEDTKNLEEPITASYWNLIWTGDKYSIHTVEVHSEKDRTNYIWKFTVYFRGEAYGDHENGIFYNDHQCWMYLDK